jgi:hypothetical protein
MVLKLIKRCKSIQRVPLGFPVLFAHPRCFSPVFQPECRIVAVTLPQGGINDEKKIKVQICSHFKNIIYVII